jgi:hypothetical protein
MSTFETFETYEAAGPYETQGEWEAYEAYEGEGEGEYAGEGEYEGEYAGEGEYEGEGEGEGAYEMEGEDEQFLGDVLGAVGRVVGPQLPGIARGIYGALSSEGESPLSETQEMELTAELLEVASEEELEEFIGKLFNGIAKGVGGLIRSPVGKALGGVLKGIAKKALPVVGGALGSMVAPGVGTALGSKLGSLASGLFEMELEGMSQEQAEFEVARRYVRLAATSAAHAATAPRTIPPQRVARVAITRAARVHAPGLLRGTSAGARRGAPVRSGGYRRRRPGYGGYPRTVSYGYDGNGGEPAFAADDGPEPIGGGTSHGYVTRQQSGRWIRRGRKIVLLGV